MYRGRVPFLLGDYDPHRFTTEDYDYWLRVNELLNLHHADFTEPVYEYRFHSDSLTARDTEMGITQNRPRLMLFDDFRRDLILSPLMWILETDTDSAGAVNLLADLRGRIARLGHVGITTLSDRISSWPRLWLPSVYLYVTSSQQVGPPSVAAPAQALKVLVHAGAHPLPARIPEGWDMCIALAQHPSVPGRLEKDYQGWFFASDTSTLFTAIDIRARSRAFELLEDELAHPVTSDMRLSAVVCAFGEKTRLHDTLASLAHQTLPLQDYEVIVVDNNPDGEPVSAITSAIRLSEYSGCPAHLRYVHCPLQGLSDARNAGISEAHGDILCFIDDDATACPDWLENIAQAFAAHPGTGVIGGHIVLQPPEPRPKILRPGLEPYWSQFITPYPGYTEVEAWGDLPWGANWSARRAGPLGHRRLSHGLRSPRP